MGDRFSEVGGNMFGFTDGGDDAKEEYGFTKSKAIRNGMMVGKMFNEKTQSELSEGRANEWVEQLRNEGFFTVKSPGVEMKCCDPEVGPGGCPDENGSFDNCWDEGGFCCSDGKWYANDGAGGSNCADNQPGDSQACLASVSDAVIADVASNESNP